ncbi:MAG: hypothetical protein H0S82_07175 [Anaerolineaceae bacterium]|nr:hypothetical protein [Anaerolineaceae bacterium]
MKEDELTLRVLSPDGQSVEADHLLEIIVPLADGGTIGIRPKHAALIAETISGPVQYQTNGEVFKVDILAGILSIRDNLVTILSAGIAEEANNVVESPADPFDELAQALENEREAAKES